MPEYYGLRAALGLVEGALFLLLIRSTIPRYLLWFCGFLFASALNDIAPAYVWNPGWWRAVALPSEVARLVLAILVTLEPVWHLRDRMYPRERSLLLMWATSLAFALALVAWLWHPENVFQAGEVARQYALMVLAVATTIVWIYLTQLRPVDLPPGMATHGLQWCLWLALAFAISTTTKGGLAWRLVEWHGGLWWWRTVSDACLAPQIGLMAWWLVRSRRFRANSPALPARATSPRSAPTGCSPDAAR